MALVKITGECEYNKNTWKTKDMIKAVEDKDKPRKDKTNLRNLNRNVQGSKCTNTQ